MKRLAMFVVLAAIGGSWSLAYPQDQPGNDPATLVQMDCQICHSGLLVQQQRLSRDTWLAEIKKMQGWGSPISNEQIAAVADYLAAQYGPNIPAMKAHEITAREAVAEIAPESDLHKRGSAERGSKLYADNCAGCHNSDARGKLGPDLVQQPILYRWKDWNDIITHGRRSMPSFGSVLSESDVADILAWVRTQKVTFGD